MGIHRDYLLSEVDHPKGSKYPIFEVPGFVESLRERGSERGVGNLGLRSD